LVDFYYQNLYNSCIVNNKEPKLKTVQEINTAILSSNLSNEDLNSVLDAVRFVRSQLVRKNTGSLVVGTRVKWNSVRLGKPMTGTVVKVGRKNIKVDVGQGNVWRVDASMLERV